ncbi:hypothetical protein Hanom_Chr06g00498201 [Helianthus anomalus]
MLREKNFLTLLVRVSDSSMVNRRVRQMMEMIQPLFHRSIGCKLAEASCLSKSTKGVK